MFGSKRDFRFVDNDACCCAQFRLPLLFFATYGANYDDSDVRHWRFIYESVQDLQDQANNKFKYIFHSEVEPVFLPSSL
jgi:deoxyribodipyrimidine photo-lyase